MPLRLGRAVFKQHLLSWDSYSHVCSGSGSKAMSVHSGSKAIITGIDVRAQDSARSSLSTPTLHLQRGKSSSDVCISPDRTRVLSPWNSSAEDITSGMGHAMAHPQKMGWCSGMALLTKFILFLPCHHWMVTVGMPWRWHGNSCNRAVVLMCLSNAEAPLLFLVLCSEAVRQKGHGDGSWLEML